MNEEERWTFITALDDELLKGGVILSEWCSFIVRETDIAFAAGAHLAAIVTAMAGIETYLRSEYGADQRMSLYALIEHSPVVETLKGDIHALRKFRNRWVHVPDPQDDQDVLENSKRHRDGLAGPVHYCAAIKSRGTAGSVVHFASAIYTQGSSGGIGRPHHGCQSLDFMPDLL
jgi:hypothetical protein